MINTEDKNKRIAKNTLFLYFRMLLTMIISLFTSRVILKNLGVEDYGIYNVVGGVITMLNFITNSLSGAESRFITFELGKGDIEKLKSTFSAIIFINYGLAFLILLLGETIGLWFVQNKLVIPEDRVVASLWVYQCSIITAIISILSTPYNSLIISHEKMSVFAYISIIEVVLKLVIVYFLMLSPYDKLVVYSILLLCVQLFIRFIYTKYSSRYFEESRVRPTWNAGLFKEIGSYSLWTMNGNLAIVGYTQGINILLNMFFGPLVNAARGIAVQVQTAALTFVQNFLVAINPQIIKSCAVEDYSYMHKLVIAASKYGFFLMLIIAFPLIVLVDPILKLWLGSVPEYTTTFVLIMLYASLLSPLSRTLVTAINATGNIKKFQIFEGTSLLMVVPIAYVMLKLFNISPEAVMWVYIGVEIFTQLIRMVIVLPAIHMEFRLYIKSVLFPILVPFLYFELIIHMHFIPIVISFLEIIGFISILCLSLTIVIIIFGLNQNERLMFKTQTENFVKKLKR